MNYEIANNRIPENRQWYKWCSCIYLQRYKKTIRIRYGYRYKSSQIMAVWYPSGGFKFKPQYIYWGMRWRLNEFMPEGYHVCNHRYCSFLYNRKEKSRLFHVRSRGPSITWKQPNWIWIIKDEVSPKLGPTLEDIKAELIQEDRQRAKPRRRGSYWTRKARGIFRKPCGKTLCDWRKASPRPTTDQEFECGCKVYTKKAKSHDTVFSIMQERNATVRTAKIQIYGIDKFFTDAKAKTINKEAGYELLEINTGLADPEPDRWDRPTTARNVVLTALRMACSTTGQVYVNTVPPELRTVRAALDWMYNTTHYLENIGVQT